MRTTIFKALGKIFRTAFDELDLGSSCPVVLKESSRPEFGDYQVNGVISIAKKLKRNPRELASQIASQIDKEDIIEKLEVAGPGFINVTISTGFLNQALTKDLLKSASVTKQETIVIDYSSPNLAKEMHVGHLRSTIIGDALARLYEFLGHKVIRRNHIGDWGTQFGMLIACLLETTDGDSGLSLELSDLENFYRKAKERFDEDLEFAKRARECVVKLQSKDPKIIAAWKKFIDVSLSHCQEIYDRLHVKLTPEDAAGESAYNDLLPVVVNDLVGRGVAVEDDGAKCVFFTTEELGATDETPFIIQKKDGAYLYSTTDIAAVYNRVENLKADHLIYVIDARQSLHLKQLFATVRKSSWFKPKTIMEHVAFGVMLGEDHKPFKTRSGGTVKLFALIDEAVTRAKKLVVDRNPNWPEDKINGFAETLGIAALKYADLSKNRISDYVFNFDQMLAFEGNTAPYMLYAYVRINSVFNKANLNMADYLGRPITIIESSERKLAIHIMKFADHLLEAAKENYPHYVCKYIYDLAVIFMQFYENCPIVQIEDIDIRGSRLALAALTANILKVSLGLLGISVVEQM